jgi:adenine-specific DNA-methyltransferase
VYGKTMLPKGFFSIAKDDDQIDAEYQEEDEGGKYRLLELRNTHREFGRHNRKNLWYPLYTNEDGEVSLIASEGLTKILPVWDDGFEGCWTWDAAKAECDIDLLTAQRIRGQWKVYRKSYASGADRMLKTILIDRSFYTERGQKEVNKLFETRTKIFQSPKSPYLLAQLICTATADSDLVIDFFAGSGTIGHAVMLQNQIDGHRRRFVLVQLPEPIDPSVKEQSPTAAYLDSIGKRHYLTEVTKERLRRCGSRTREENPLFAGDLGFRVFKLDRSNIRAWDPDRDDLTGTLLDAVEHLREGRSEQDILYELLLKLGLELTVPIATRTIVGKEVHSIGAGTLLACLAPAIDRATVEPLALGIVAWHRELAPSGEGDPPRETTLVFRDSAFADDVAKTNLAAILEQHGLANLRSL